MTDTAHNFTSFRYSTEELPPQQRLSTVHETLDRSLGGRLTIRPLSDRPCRVDITGYQLRAGTPSDMPSDLSVIRVTSKMICEVLRTPEPAAFGHNVVLHIHETGRRIVSQLGRQATVEAGGGLLVSNSHPSAQLVPEPSRFVLIGVPLQVLKALAPGFENVLARPLPPNSGVLRLLTAYLNILEDREALQAPELRHAVANHIHDLCALAIGATRDALEIAEGRGLRAARLRAIKDDVVQHLETGNVSVVAVAMRQRLTPRYIHKLFESEGATLSRFVLGQRLARVHRRLTDARCATLAISTIAYGAGFGDLSTFNREFRRHYGMTPSDVRATARKH